MHFQRMPTILIAVGYVVEQVDNARQDAKHCERKTRLGEGMKIEQTPPEDDPRQQQDVLGPLAGTQRLEHGSCSRHALDARGCNLTLRAWLSSRLFHNVWRHDIWNLIRSAPMTWSATKELEAALSVIGRADQQRTNEPAKPSGVTEGVG